MKWHRGLFSSSRHGQEAPMPVLCRSGDVLKCTALLSLAPRQLHFPTHMLLWGDEQRKVPLKRRGID